MPILGLRGTGSFTVTGQRPESWREGILRLYPNGHAPLTALMSMLPSEPTDDPIFHWFQKDLPTERAFINNAAGYSATDTVLKIDDGAGAGLARMCKRGTVLLNETTLEQMLVIQDPVDADSITVLRGFGEVAAAAMADDEPVLITGSAYEQGSDVPSAVSYDPTEHKNYVQTFRESLALTRIGMRTRYRTGDAYEQAKLDALEQISIKMEKAFLWGQQNVATINGQLIYTMKGLTRFISTNVFTPAGGNITEDLMDTYMEDAFKYGSGDKLALVGGKFLNALNSLLKGKVTINVVPGNEVYGMRVREYITAVGGVLYIKLHPLMNIHPEYTKDAIIVDTSFIRYRYIDDLRFIQNRQDPGKDARIDEFLADASLEIQHEKAHAWIKGVTGYA